MSTLKIGVDVGNYDTKTQHTTTPSSFECYTVDRRLEQEILKFDGRYYAPTDTRNHQEKDKTEKDYALIMTLFGIAKEILAQIGEPGELNLQSKISEVDSICLGEGLPVGYFSELSDKTREYFTEKFKNGISFAYRDLKYSPDFYIFNLRVDNIMVYPQDILGVMGNGKLYIPNHFEDYYIFGWGGGTLDIIPVKDNAPRPEKCRSYNDKGTTVMYQKINENLQKNGFNVKDYGLIEKVLLGRPTCLKDEEVKIINAGADEFVTSTLHELANTGLKFSDYPSVFIGGGALLLKSRIEKSNELVKCEFVESVNENARFFAKTF